MRALYAGLLAFVIALATGPALIYYLRRWKFGQVVRQDGPKTHLRKSGIPTMGGVIMLAAATISTLVFTEEHTHVAWALFLTLGFGLIGLLDDFFIIVKGRSLGLRARQKLLGQVLLAGLLGFYAASRPELGTKVFVPFSLLSFDLGALYIPFAIMVVVGASNAVNLTDGLDGLAAGSTAIATIAYTVIALRLGNPDLALFSAAISGGCLGFSWFNAHPAQVFMGDTGSLALGAALGALSILTKTELSLVIIGGLFVIETISVILQVAYFRFTHGKRIFMMSPLHHHFELSGWLEPKVVVRFWIIEAIFAVIGLVGSGAF
mgnify:CR=1 FL=1